MSGPSIRRAGLTVVLFTIAGKVLGLVREVVVAATYGTSQTVDIYLAGITVPALIGTILSQALPNAFVPIFAGDDQLRRRGKTYAWVLVACLGAVAIVLWFLAVRVSVLTSGGFASNARAEVIVVLKIAAASVVLVAIEALARARLLARKRFARSGAAGLWSSAVMIVAVGLFPGGGTQTLVWGFVAGILAASVWNLIPLGRGQQTADRPIAPLTNSASSFTLRWVVAVIAIDLIRQTYALIDRHFASFLSEGSIAALQYADLVASSPVAVCGTALAIAAFPYLSEAFHRNDVSTISTIIDRAARWSLLGAIPATVLLSVFGSEVITLLFERGAFDASSRTLTGPILKTFSLGVVPGVLGAIAVRVLYSAGRWRIVLLGTVAGILVKYGCSTWWVELNGAVGLAAATVLSSAVIVAVLFVGFPRGSLRDHWLGWVHLTVVVAGLYTAGSLAVREILRPLPSGEWSSALVRVTLGFLAGVILLIGFGPAAGVSEIARSRRYIRERLLRR